ncbi:SURF1 family cytochrome oxidase biogenesis protein [Salinibacterium sp. SWN248]|uniref:SURF1 family cytochrome oxidase biogenesis protein n=1 Tax=Salinibacterium sp. SWN248 TaxID=2792056 RepID=UPI0027DAB34F|nr:SURF1 family cytochrome oxidase biogenesis protein [Salinibacterium sp. SWN248]
MSTSNSPLSTPAPNTEPATMWEIARRPRWIGALVLALAIAASFAALGQWQLSRSLEGGEITEQQSESVVELDSVATAQEPLSYLTTGQTVTLTAELIAGDYVILSDRNNDSQGMGYWVVAHGVEPSGASIAIALGWAESADAAASAVADLDTMATTVTITGRLLPTESPQQSDFEEGERSALAVSELVNLWSEVPAGTYGGYVISFDAPAGLETIDSPPPSTEVSLNLLNVFYAVEWVVFAGFAVFLWFRLVRDVWEEEREARSSDAAVD